MGTRLYVGNLPFSAGEDEIRDLFAQNGRSVVEVRLITDRETGRQRGFGFVEMANQNDADAAIRELKDPLREKLLAALDAAGEA